MPDDQATLPIPAPAASPDMWRSYAEPTPAQPSPLTPKNLTEAENAVATMMRWQGARAFSQALQAGTPPEQAFYQHGPKMFFNNPQAYAAALRQIRPPRPPQVMDLGGGARAVVGAGGTVHMVPTPKPVVDPAEAWARQSAAIRLRGAVAESGKALLPEERAAAEAKIQQIERDTMGRFKKRSNAPAADAGQEGIKIRRKSDGKIMLYRGDGKDVPLDKYELIPEKD